MSAAASKAHAFFPARASTSAITLMRLAVYIKLTAFACSHFDDWHFTSDVKSDMGRRLLGPLPTTAFSYALSQFLSAMLCRLIHAPRDEEKLCLGNRPLFSGFIFKLPLLFIMPSLPSFLTQFFAAEIFLSLLRVGFHAWALFSDGISTKWTVASPAEAKPRASWRLVDYLFDFSLL